MNQSTWDNMSLSQRAYWLERGAPNEVAEWRVVLFLQTDHIEESLTEEKLEEAMDAMWDGKDRRQAKDETMIRKGKMIEGSFLPDQTHAIVKKG